MFSQLKGLVFLLKQAITGSKKTFTTGSIDRAIVLLSVPMVLEMAMESLFVCINLFFVSKLGQGAIAVVGATGSIVTLAYSVSVGLGIAASAIVSRRVGEKKLKTAGLATMQILYIAVSSGLLLSIACLLFHQQILRIVGLSSSLIQEGASYTQLMFMSIVFVIIRTTINGVFRGSGDAAVAMRSLWITNVSNMVLAPLFIFGLGPFPVMGLLGAGVATLLARALGVLYQSWFLLSGKTIVVIGRSQLLFVPSIAKKVAKLASAGMVQYLIPASSWVVMIKIVSYFGHNALAGYIIAQRVTSIATMPAWGIGNAAGVLTGQNLGANQLERAEKSVWKAGFINMYFLLTIALLWWQFAEPIVRLFSKEENVVSNGVMYIHYSSIAYLLMAYTMVISRALNASGSVKLVTGLYILMFYVFQLPLSYALGVALNWGPKGIFTAIVLSEVVLATACILVFRKGDWKYRKV